MHSRLSPFFAAAFAALLAAPLLACAQEATIHLRIVAVQGEGTLSEGETAAFEKRCEPFRELLEAGDVRFSSYRFLGCQTVEVEPEARKTFELPLGFTLSCTCRRGVERFESDIVLKKRDDPEEDPKTVAKGRIQPKVGKSAIIPIQLPGSSVYLILILTLRDTAFPS